MVKVGVLMLNTIFPRLVGDIGRNEGLDFETEYYFVEGATSKSVVLSDSNLIDQFVKGAIQLQKRGCDIITTSCGFLIKYQREIAKMISVPFISSSLLICNYLHEIFSNHKIPVLTANKERLLNIIKNHEYFTTVDYLTYFGMENSYFYSVYVENKVQDESMLDKKRLYNELGNRIRLIKKDIDNANIVVFECINMSPFRKNLSEEFGIKIIDINTILRFINIL